MSERPSRRSDEWQRFAHKSTGVTRPMIRIVNWLGRTTSAHLVLVLTAVIGVAIVSSLTVAGAEIYDAVSEKDGVARWDRPVLDLALAWRTPRLDTVLTWFTHLGGPLGMTVIASVITALMVWRWRSRTPLILMVIAVAGSLTITSVGKQLFARMRPPLRDAVPPFESSPSFPSGHALNSTVIAGLVAFLIWTHLVRGLARAVTVLAAFAWAVTIGLSRVFLGHHWLTDVMFGWLIGLAWLGVVLTAHRLYVAIHPTAGPSVHPTTRSLDPRFARP